MVYQFIKFLVFVTLLLGSSLAIASGLECRELFLKNTNLGERERAQAQFLKSHLKYNSLMPQVGMGIELGMTLAYINAPYSLSLLEDAVQNNQLYDQVAHAMNKLHAASQISHRAQENNQIISQDFTHISRDRVNSLIATSYLILLSDVLRVLEKTWIYPPKDFYDINTPLVKERLRGLVSVTAEGTSLDWKILKDAAEYIDRNQHRLQNGLVNSERLDLPSVVDFFSSFMGNAQNDSTALGRLLKEYRAALSTGDLSVRSNIQMQFLHVMILEYRKALSSSGDVMMLLWIETFVGSIGVNALNDMFPDLNIQYGSYF